jgi:DNA-directed RNA polymerase subunit RPC12/RpoP
VSQKKETCSQKRRARILQPRCLNPPTHIEAWGLELNALSNEQLLNSSFQDAAGWSAPSNDLGYSMPFCYAGASLNDDNQHVDRFCAASPDITTISFSHDPALRTDWDLMPALWEPLSESIEARTLDSQSSLPPSQENQSLGNEPNVISPISLYKYAVCDKVTSDMSKHRQHLKHHGYTCHQCARSFTSHADLNRHAEIHGHESYHCNDCDASFSRLDVLKRHKLQHVPSPVKYSCSHCKKWKAPNGFERKDHLTQHLRNYHHIHIHTENAYVPYLPNLNPRWLGFYAYCLHQEFHCSGPKVIGGIALIPSSNLEESSPSTCARSTTRHHFHVRRPDASVLMARVSSERGTSSST